MSCTFLPEIVDPADGRKLTHEPNSVLLLRGPGHNLMRERADGASEDSLTALQTIEERLAKVAESQGLKLYAAQSNVEGYLINHIHAARRFGCIIFSPGAYCHYSYALYDALLQTSSTPWLEVHIGNMYAKEDFRKSVLAPLCSGFIVGCGALGYEMAMLRAKELIAERKK
ncbi:type II 3-dehydroquinate dehydratase [Cystobasidium minutum MCA 4210]|uniref:type II 3-dehydroquinate dehydratase n=1 Tax=Cystobasidium minutum MCA 4210 TaxID=1397322 RepID=UPI0034CE6D00|eukprot:jgi/Rhomi1/198647/gm1.6861_g